MELYPLYLASGGRPARSKIIDRVRLQVQGISIDHIRTIAGQPYTASNVVFEDTLCVIRSWIQSAGINLTAADSSISNNSTHGTNIARTRFLRTILTDAQLSTNLPSTWHRLSRSSPPERSSSLSAILSDAALGGYQPPLHNSLTESLFIATYSRSFFLTSRGSLGICPSHAQVGDEVWALDVANTIFVLRPISGQEPSDLDIPDFASGTKICPRQYKLVGECYLDEFVDGEAVEMNSTGDGTSIAELV